MTTVYRQRPIEPAPKPGLKREDFSKICENGFGDGHNSHAHSMTWWKDHLYVGTTRSLLCALKVHKYIGEWNLETWPIECPDDVDGLYKLVDRRAQIWRYNPTTQEWHQVMQAPMVMGSEGEEVPRDIGYRCMTVFQGESDAQPALYVVTTAPGRGPGALILRSEDGENFTPASDYGILGLPITSIRFAVPFKGKLFTSPNATRGSRHNTSDFPIVYESRDPGKRQWQAASLSGFGDPHNEAVFMVCPFRDQLYAGTFNCSGFQIWRTDCVGDPPYQWTKIIDQGAYRGSLNQIAASMIVFNDALYVGTAIQNGGYDITNRIGPAPSELIRILPDDSWELVVGTPRDTPDGRKEPISSYQPGFGNFFNGYFWCMEVHDGWLYLGTCNGSVMLTWAAVDKMQDRAHRFVEEIGIDNIVKNQSGFELWRTRDGENWLPVDRKGFGNPYNVGVRNIVSTPNGLFIGTANLFGPRVAIKQNAEWIYTDNPRGGLEVWLGST
jgi:hypothetical protein